MRLFKLSMKRLLLSLIATFAFPTAVNAGVDPEVHSICLKASDYAGCVKVQTEGIAAPTRMIIQEGASISEGMHTLTLMHMLGTVIASVCFAI